MKYDILVVGAGLSGSIIACELSKLGRKCLVIDRRSHIGGNVYTENISGINVHKYGAHIFHTSNKKVWDYVNSFVEFNRYTNSPVAVASDGRMYNLPFNMNTFNQMWGVKTPAEAKMKLDEQRREAIATMKEQGVITPRNLEEQALMLIGRDIYERLIKGYTEKQWGRRCVDLPAFIIRRLPVRMVFDNNYFNDLYQGVPVGGYTRLVEKMLEGIEVQLSTDYIEKRGFFNSIADKIVYTGEIDRFYEYCYGHLEYRTLRLEVEKIDEVANYQGNAVVNYTAKDVLYTRIIEHKHFEMFGDEVANIPATVVTREYPDEWKLGDEPYYPVNDEQNNLLYKRYESLAKKETNICFCGRLAEYRYYDMHQVVAKALDKVGELL